MGRANNERMRSPAQERTDATRVASRADQSAVRSRQDKMGKVAELAASFGPTGDLMAAKDAVVEGRKGNWGKAALAAASIIPGVGAIGDAARAADKAGDAAKVFAKVATKPGRASKAEDIKDAAKKVYHIIDRQTKQVVGKASSLKRATTKVNKLDNAYGGYRYHHKLISGDD